MKRFGSIIFTLVAGCTCVMACTSAIVAGYATASGRPLLWKHRDTGHELNFIERVPSRNGELGYVALFNSGDSLLTEAWVGFNDSGFAIMNTASYNLAPDTVSLKDREGVIMTMALKQCGSVNDFERLLIELPKPLGVQANFGVIDAMGNGAYFETDGYVFTKYDVNDTPDGIMIRTNFSYSGKYGDGLGWVRYVNACCLIDPYVCQQSITPETLLNDLSCSFYNSEKNKDIFECGQESAADVDFIPRYSTSASVVIEGVMTPELAGDCIMWVRPGYPPCSSVYEITTDSIPRSLRPVAEGWNSPAWLYVTELKHSLFYKKDKQYYVNMDILRRLK